MYRAIGIVVVWGFTAFGLGAYLHRTHGMR